MKRIHIIGRKNHGKTTLVTELVRELTALGLRVGTIKHTHHQHELDAPGKDSFLHREAGSAVVGILSRGMNAVFWPPEDSTEKANAGADARDAADARYEGFAAMFAGCDLVLVEGDIQTRGAKLEVWRAAQGSRPLAEDDPSILSVVTDDDPAVSVPTIPRSDVSVIAQQVLKILGISAKADEG